MRGSFTRNIHWIVAAFCLVAVLLMTSAMKQIQVAGANRIATRPVDGVPFQRGDVLAGIDQGLIKHFNGSGTLLDTLDTTSGFGEAGMCFDAQGNLYATDYVDRTMSKFNSAGVLLQYPWGVPFSGLAESCIVDSTGNVYVGQSDSPRAIIKLDPNGVELATYSPATGPRGTDCIDLSADQCTMLYTSEGGDVRRFDVCTNTQLPVLTSALTPACYALRIRPNGEVMVACQHRAYRLSASGTIIQTYEASAYGFQYFFGMNLDPDDTSFWVGGSSRLYKIDIQTGNQITSFSSNSSLLGVAVFGEITASGATPTPNATPIGGATATPFATQPPTQTPGGPTATPEPCLLQFTDVPPEQTFYTFIRCLACRGVMSGYQCGGLAEPCDADNHAYFRPGNQITRGQIAKIVSNAAGFSEDPGPQIYEDVDLASTFYQWINRLSVRGYMGGYPCGTVRGEPCIAPDNPPYFRTNANATRGQLAKIVSNAAGITGTPTGLYYTDVPEASPFYLWIMRLTGLGVMSGYPCGGPNEACDDQQHAYFRPQNNVTRGQASKIVANTFFPDCQTFVRK